MSSWRFPWSQITFKRSIFYFIFRYVASAENCTEQLAGVVNSTGRITFFAQVQNQQVSIFPMSVGLLVGRSKQIRTLIFFSYSTVAPALPFWLCQRCQNSFSAQTHLRNPFSLLAPQPLFLLCWAITLGWFVLTSERELLSWGLQGTMDMTVRSF